MLDVVWGIFDQDGDGTRTKAEFMDVSAVGCFAPKAAGSACVELLVLTREQVLEARASRGGSRRNRQGLNDCVATWLKGIMG